MLITVRSALLICAALSASSVAPAQVQSTSALATAPVSLQQASLSIPERLPSPGDEVSPEVAPSTDEVPQNPEVPQIQEPQASAPAVNVNKNEDLPNLVAELRSSKAGNHELECLAAGVYFESKGEPLAGQLAVGKVIANRTHSGRFPSTYCGVLMEPGQFSFIHAHSWPHVSADNRQWQTAVAIATIVDRDLKDSVAENALYFHARRVHPGWHFHEVASIGNHVFFR
jgi:spore germination cell wall hydrolase CwlJ-like protein